MPSSVASSGKPRRLAAAAAVSLLSSSSSSSACCKHSSPSATLDLFIFVLVLFSCTFLISSSFSYIFRSLSQILPSLLHPLTTSFHEAPLPYAAGFLLFVAASLLVAAEIPCGSRGGGGGETGRRSSWFRWWSRRCGNPRCRGLKKAMEFDVQLQTEESVKAAEASPDAAVWREIDGLPWKGGEQGNSPEYECLRVELRKMAPPNGRAVLLFRARCGCPLAKLEAWGPKRGRRHKNWFLCQARFRSSLGWLVRGAYVSAARPTIGSSPADVTHRLHPRRPGASPIWLLREGNANCSAAGGPVH